ncbi:MAG: hypothetical protein H6932_09565 [Burkholderiaceae bacterium]|nr:hypothetical protein [Burkholderiaceae bacterium]
MSAEDDFGGFAPPPFKAAEALVQLRRQLRDLRPLAERGTRYEIGGRAVLELAAEDAAIVARIAKRPALTPEWTTSRLGSSLDVRRFVDTVRQRLRQWDNDE